MTGIMSYLASGALLGGAFGVLAAFWRNFQSALIWIVRLFIGKAEIGRWCNLEEPVLHYIFSTCKVSQARARFYRLSSEYIRGEVHPIVYESPNRNRSLLFWHGCWTACLTRSIV